MQAIFLVVHVILALSLIGLILIQHGKGADAGAAFGSGASSTVFGARGSASFITRMTTYLAVAFFLNCFWLNYLTATKTVSTKSVIEALPSDSATETLGTTVEEITDKKPAIPELVPPKVETDVPTISTPAANDATDVPSVKTTPEHKPAPAAVTPSQSDAKPADSGVKADKK